MPGLFSNPCKCGRTISPRGRPRCVCRAPAAPISQLINVIFTHLFLNVLNDGKGAGSSSEVLTWQIGMKGEVSQCQEQDFNSKLRDILSFAIH